MRDDLIMESPYNPIDDGIEEPASHEQIKELKYSVFVHVLMGIYVDFKMLKEIAYDEHISYQEVRGMHEPALKCFEEFHSDALDEWERGRH